VSSALHTNDDPQKIARPMNIGIAPFNITSSVTLQIAGAAQRAGANGLPNLYW